MKYIRTKDGVYEIVITSPLGFVRIDKRDGTYPDVFEKFEKDIIKQADTIDELIDEYVCGYESVDGIPHTISTDYIEMMAEWGDSVYGAIWTDKGLIYVAKMNDKGELELL